MEARELRIGNIVQAVHPRYGQGPIRVETIGIESINIDFRDYRYNEIEPIQITEELLFRLGFEIDEHYHTYTNNSGYCIVYREQDQDREAGFYIQNDNNSDAYCHSMMNKPIKYAHKLQNIYFELGVELTFLNTKP